MKTLSRTALLLLSAGLFVFAVAKIGSTRMLSELDAMSGGFAVIVALSGVRLCLQTRSWSIALRQDGVDPSPTELMLLRLAAQGIGYLTILGPAASEPIKIKFLQHYRGSATAATLVDTGMYWLSAAIVILAGCLSATVVVAQNQLASVVLAAILTAGIFLLVQPKTLLEGLTSSLGTRAPGWLTKTVQIENAIRRFARMHPAAIRQMFLLDLACQVLLLAEVAAALYCLHLPVRAGSVLSIEAAGRAVRLLGGWVPARIGADEGGAAAAFAALGLPAAAGLALALVRRLRDMISSLIGLVWFACRTKTHGGAPTLTGALTCKL